MVSTNRINPLHLLLTAIYINHKTIFVYASQDTLELVHVLFRHGNRTPEVGTYPNDPYQHDTYYPYENGELTLGGMHQAYYLGQRLRERYKDFLGEYYNGIVEPRSTDINRTKQTLMIVLQSLFELDKGSVEDDIFPWRAIPIKTVPYPSDLVMGYPELTCDAYAIAYGNYFQSEEGKKLMSFYSPHIDKLQKLLGTHSMTLLKLANLYLQLTTQVENGNALPAELSEYYPEFLTNLALASYIACSATPTLKKFSSGFFVKKIIDDTYLKINGEKNTTKMYLYGGHEFNIASVLRFLDVFEPHVPTYTAYFIVEVHNISNVRAFRIFYQNYSTKEPKLLNIPKCGTLCNIDDFQSLYQNQIPQDATECIPVDVFK